MTHPAGTIILPLADTVRFPQFVYSLATLQQPEGTSLSIIRSASVADNVNDAIRSMTGDWVWLLGDDHVFQPDLLTVLLDHQVDIVVPLCYKRVPPYHLVAFMEDGTREWSGREYPAWKPIQMNELPDDGLVEIDGAGGAGMLIRKEVLDAVGEPWLESSAGPATNEDLLFCMKARQAGYTIHLDCGSRLGHLGMHTIWPERRDDYTGWMIQLGNGHEVLGQPREAPVAV